MIAIEIVRELALGTWLAIVATAPYLFFGLLIAGLLHVLVPKRSLARWMGGEGLAAASRAALLGIPLPICSCGIVPVSIALRRRGAGRPATMAFLITTPESSADAIVLTWGLLGPVMAIARPLVSFVTAFVAAAAAIVWPDSAHAFNTVTPRCNHHHGDHSHDHHHPHNHHDHDHPAEAPHQGHEHDLDEEDGYVGVRALLRSIHAALFSWLNPRPDGPGTNGDANADADDAPPRLTTIVRAVGQRAFVEYVDDVVFWLLLGLIAAGAITAWLPPEWVASLGRGIWPMLALLAIGIPMYICASASTPIAAALLAKGVSPGSALVFMLAGPATNAATIALLGRHFGRGFVRIYLASVCGTTLLCGLAFDALVVALGLEIRGAVAPEAAGPSGLWATIVAIALLVLMARRLVAGAWRVGVSELRDNLGRTIESLRRRFGPTVSLRRLVVFGLVLLGLVWLGSGLRTIPPDSRAYRISFGRVTERDLGPGLAASLPWPLGRLDVRRVRYPRKTDIGYRTDFGMIERRRLLTKIANPDDWHSPVAAMNSDPTAATFLAGDENLLEMSFTVHYHLVDPYAFFYQLDKERDAVALYAQAAARRHVATRRLDELLTADRRTVEREIARDLAQSLTRIRSGVAIDAVRIVDIHPPQEAVAAFRDVSSAREERATAVHRAHEELARAVPRAAGEAALEVAAAQAQANGAAREAEGQAQGFLAKAREIARRREILKHLLWIEAAERALAGKRKVILPQGAKSRLSLWPPFADRPPSDPANPYDDALSQGENR